MTKPTCPSCGSHEIDRVDVVQRTVLRRIEEIRDTRSIYGMRPISTLPDRPTGSSGRRGEGLRCDHCGWSWNGSTGDVHHAPEFQEALRLLTDRYYSAGPCGNIPAEPARHAHTARRDEQMGPQSKNVPRRP